MTNDPGVGAKQESLSGLAFPVIKVRFAGPTNTLGSRYIATLRDVRATHHYEYEFGGPENARLAAFKCWDKYQLQRSEELMDDSYNYPESVTFIPGDLSSDAYVFTVVPAGFLA